MNDNYQNLTKNKKERRELRRKEKEKEKSRTKRRKTMRRILVWLLVVSWIGGGIFGIAKLTSQSSHNQAGFDVTKQCVTHGRLGMHIHPHLSIFINGARQDIPANIGIASAICMRPIHTHDASGKLHIEWRTVRDFTLGEFFKIWGKPFNSEQILDHKVNETYKLTVTVNGAHNGEYENLILRDKDRIVIEYKER